jgi:exonuclease III
VKPDIVCLQETHSTSREEFVNWLSRESAAGNNPQHYSVFSSPGSVRSRGVAVLLKPGFTVDSDVFDGDGRLQILHLSLPCSSAFQLVNIYGPNKKNDGIAFFESVLPQLAASLPSVVCGDFNTVVDPSVDRVGCNPSSPWAYNWPISLANLTKEMDLQDVWRLRHPTDRCYTWSRMNGSQASRLDMFWLSSSLIDSVTDIGIYPYFRSDHSYVFMTFSLPSTPERGPGLWKFNSSLLSDRHFTAQVTAFWLEWQLEKSSFPSLGVWWDAGKKRLKWLIREHSRQQTSLRRSRVQSLEKALTDLSRRQVLGEDVASQIKDVRDDLDLEFRHRAHGAMIRSKEQWAEEGETSSSYFFRKEKSSGMRRLFSGIRNAQGIIVRSISAILHVWCLYYVHLFTASCLSQPDQEFFLDSLDLKLSDAESSLCEGDVLNAECLAALRSFKNNKSPGIDGLSYEFYRHFWTLLGGDLVDVFNSSLTNGLLSFSQRTGVITLLHKKDDRFDTKNWRPISLLCTDYKILSKVLTNRLKPVISSVISNVQSCGVPGRFSGESVRMLQDIVDHANFSNIGAAILSLDQEKAFDRVDWPFMLKVLERMNFGPTFRSWVALLYTDIFSRVLVNGFSGELFRVTRGVRQGCPLSPLLYILVAETLSRALQKDSRIDGFELMGGQRVKVCQYADDTSILVQSDQALLSVFSLFSRYERASGAKLNVSKSHGLLIGSWRGRSNMPVPLKWSSDSITVLGCQIGTNAQPNWVGLIENLKSKISLWKGRQLSFRGRALLANVLGLSTFWYQATIFDMPKTVIFEVNKLLFPFVWNKKREWLARSSITQPVDRGGLGVVDVGRKVSSLRVIWIRRLLANSSGHPWMFFFNHHVQLVFHQDVHSLFVRDTIPAYLVKRLPPFYSSLVRAWIDLKGTRVGGAWVVPRPRGVPVPTSEVSAKMGYSFLSDYQHVDHRAFAKFAQLSIPVDWQVVWINLRLWRFVRSVQDTAWLSSHGILPTADRLVRFGMNVDPLCFCGQPESLVHLFTSCTLATEILSWFMLQLRKHSSLVVLTDAQILFGFTSSSHTPIVFTALLGVLRHHMWLARNSHRFDGIHPFVPDILKKARSTFRFLVRMHKRHCPQDRFVREWLADGIIGSVTDQDWIHFSPDFIT